MPSLSNNWSSKIKSSRKFANLQQLPMIVKECLRTQDKITQISYELPRTHVLTGGEEKYDNFMLIMHADTCFAW